jgi:anti-sigma factor RsiW
MSDFKQTELMHAVLDGEATPGEASQLERLLAADPVARTQFEELRKVFDALSALPKEFPEGKPRTRITSGKPAAADYSSD